MVHPCARPRARPTPLAKNFECSYPSSRAGERTCAAAVKSCSAHFARSILRRLAAPKRSPSHSRSPRLFRLVDWHGGRPPAWNKLQPDSPRLRPPAAPRLSRYEVGELCLLFHGIRAQPPLHLGTFSRRRPPKDPGIALGGRSSAAAAASPLRFRLCLH